MRWPYTYINIAIGHAYSLFIGFNLIVANVIQRVFAARRLIGIFRISSRTLRSFSAAHHCRLLENVLLVNLLLLLLLCFPSIAQVQKLKIFLLFFFPFLSLSLTRLLWVVVMLLAAYVLCVIVIELYCFRTLQPYTHIDAATVLG